jgi:hypothetical protein
MPKSALEIQLVPKVVIVKSFASQISLLILSATVTARVVSYEYAHPLLPPVALGLRVNSSTRWALSLNRPVPLEIESLFRTDG